MKDVSSSLLVLASIIGVAVNATLSGKPSTALAIFAGLAFGAGMARLWYSKE